jgi:uncharacterized membrane protein
MNRTKWTVGAIASGVILLVVAANYFGFFKGKSGPGAGRAQREALLKQDRKNLERADAREDEIRNALMRLAAAQDPSALEEALKRVKSPSVQIRGAVAFALGRFSDPRSLEGIKQLLEDTAPEVRRDAIRGMGMRPDDSRKALLEGMKSKKDLSPGERVALLEVLLRWDGDGKNKAEAMPELLSMARSSDPMIKNQAIGLLASRYRGDAKVVSLLKEKLQNGQEPSDRVLALHHLVSMRDPWVMENFKKLSVDSSSPELQTVGLQLLARVCPPRPWEIVESKMSGGQISPQLKSAALSALAGLGGAKAFEVLEKWKSEGKLSDPMLQPMIKQLSERVAAQKAQPGRCEVSPTPAAGR